MTTPFIIRLQYNVTRGAGLKAGGAAWAEVADELGVPVGVVREWPRVFPGPWAAAYDEAADRIDGECLAELQAAVDGVRSNTEPAWLGGQLARDALMLCHKECESVRTGKIVAC